MKTNTSVAAFRGAVDELESGFFEQEELQSPVSEDAIGNAFTREDLAPVPPNMSFYEDEASMRQALKASREHAFERIRERLEVVEEASDFRIVASDGTVVWSGGQIPLVYESAASSLIRTSLLLSRLSQEKESVVCARFRGIAIKAVGFSGNWAVIGSAISDLEEERFVDKARFLHALLSSPLGSELY
ncbi:MAG: hypothetical protein H6727_07775 [Myxococcales bacterium]|nr:hypothetical protein [Myxococcales bacterium]